MEVIVAEDYDEMSRIAAEKIEALLAIKPDACLGLTTGNTPLGLYSLLIKRHRQGYLDFSRVTVVSLEEYAGMAPDHPQSLYGWLNRELLQPCGIRKEQVVRLRAEESDLEEVCRQWESAVAAVGGMDLVVEGVGTNGHVGFNEPGASRLSRVCVVPLLEETLDYNQAYWNEEVPKSGLTAGLEVLLQSGELLLLAAGTHKAAALALALEGPVTAEVPASYVRQAKQCTVIADRAAAAKLSLHLRKQTPQQKLRQQSRQTSPQLPRREDGRLC